MLSAGSWKRLVVMLAALVFTGCSKEKTMTATTMPKKGKVYLVSRSEYEVPMGHRVDVFDSPDLLSWFQEHWGTEELERIISGESRDADGTHASWSGFSQIFSQMEESKSPQTWDELKTFLEDCHTEGATLVTEHAVQGLTDDDEIDTVWYLFDDEFAEANPGRVGYLLHDRWQLDEAVGEAGASSPESTIEIPSSGNAGGEGKVYCVFVSALDGLTIRDITGNRRFDGMRLPGFRDYLCQAEVPLAKRWDGNMGPAWPEELLLLRAAFLRSEPSKDFHQALLDLGPNNINQWLPLARPLSDLAFNLKEERFLAGEKEGCQRDWRRLMDAIVTERSKSNSHWSHEMMPPLVQASPHFCQIRFHEKGTGGSGADLSEGHQGTAWLFFDDLWMTAHPDLAESLLRYGKGWDVLFDEKGQ